MQLYITKNVKKQLLKYIIEVIQCEDILDDFMNENNIDYDANRDQYIKFQRIMAEHMKQINI